MGIHTTLYIQSVAMNRHKVIVNTAESIPIKAHSAKVAIDTAPHVRYTIFGTPYQYSPVVGVTAVLFYGRLPDSCEAHNHQKQSERHQRAHRS